MAPKRSDIYERRFSIWHSWTERDEHEAATFPGVHVVAITRSRLKGRRFSWLDDIAYIGMTNSIAGLKSRLRQFDRTMAGKLEHGGADRVRFRYRDYARFTKRAYVAVAAFRSNPASNLAQDLRVMGNVARFEYQCLAWFVDEFGRLPDFNDKSARKFSLAMRTSPRARRAT